jgi:hypothetical protein
MTNSMGNLFFLFVLFIIAAMGLLLLMPNPQSLPLGDLDISNLNNHHIENSHPERLSEVEIVRKCTENPLGEFLNPSTGRLIRCGFDQESGKWGIQVLEKDSEGKISEVTAFLKNKMKTFEQVITYLKNRGYTIQK